MTDVSFLKKLSALSQSSGLERLILLDAQGLTDKYTPPSPPDMPVLVTGISSQEMMIKIQKLFLAIYPNEHGIGVINQSTSSDRKLADFSMYALSFPLSIYFPPLDSGTSFETFTGIVAHLRAPNGCPWDREQTHSSLRTHLLEEAYEAMAAIDDEDFMSMQEELGDLLLQIILQSQIAFEEGKFTITQVIQGIHDKILRRHPHVFGDLELSGVEGVLANWEKLKEAERFEKKEGKGLLDGVPLALPALTQAQEYQDRAARVGFDWPEIEGVLDKVKEEILEISEGTDPEQAGSEMGDLLFVLVNLARWKKMDAESILRQANARFKRRFGFVERGAQEKNKLLSEMSLEEMNELWEAGKAMEG